MQEEKTILEAREETDRSPYRNVEEAFSEWWRNSEARKGYGGLTRHQVAEMAYGAGVVLGAMCPVLAQLEDIEVLDDLKAVILANIQEGNSEQETE